MRAFQKNTGVCQFLHSNLFLIIFFLCLSWTFPGFLTGYACSSGNDSINSTTTIAPTLRASSAAGLSLRFVSSAEDNEKNSGFLLQSYRFKLMRDKREVSHEYKDVSKSVASSFIASMEGEIYYNHTAQNFVINMAQRIKEFSENYLTEISPESFGELLVYDNHLIVTSHSHGIIYYSPSARQLVPKYIITEALNSHKIMHIQWATEKDNMLWLGPGSGFFGKREQVLSCDKFNIVTIDKKNKKTHIDWTSNFVKILTTYTAATREFQTIESVKWSQHLKKWIMLLKIDIPARNKKPKEITSLLLHADEDFTKITYNILNRTDTAFHYSSFTFIPGTNDAFSLAVQVNPRDPQTSLSVIETLTGRILLENYIIQNKVYTMGILDFFPNTKTKQIQRKSILDKRIENDATE